MDSDQKNSQFSDRRQGGRYEIVTGDAPSRLSDVGSDVVIDFRIRDISPRGMGVIVKRETLAGQRLILTWGKREVVFEVRWCQQYLGIEGMWVAGVVSFEPGLDLLAIARANGCELKKVG